MKWVKKGLIIEPTEKPNWWLTHTAIPIADKIGEDYYRIYFAGRNSKNRSQIGYIKIDINKPQTILYVSKNPVLELGSLGTFDDSAVTPSWIINYDNKKYLYYNGWMQGKRVPYYASIGLAISLDGGKTFKKYSIAPLLPRNDIDPYMTHTPCVMIENGLWKMWYASGLRWEIENNKPKPYYHIKYAESKDAINWERKGIVCIDFISKEEWAISRPCIIKEDGVYKMWYSYSIRRYRIGYAESENGIHWERKDNEVGIDISKSGWDSEMIEYPFVFEHKGRKYMLYNGNNYGKTGLGYAILDEK